MLRTKFRNLRRPARAAKAVVTIPSPKKFKASTSSTVVEPPSASDDAEYKRHIDFIQRSYHLKWSHASMLALLKQTAKQRRSWIKTKCPSIKDVLTTFPCLADPKLVRIIIIATFIMERMCLAVRQCVHVYWAAVVNAGKYCVILIFLFPH